ncbi:unnamed protein product [Symbiodinium sp. CCMP2592]|nr:unnamed protein product [Symbiodinium sp. CCMP2592]
MEKPAYGMTPPSRSTKQRRTTSPLHEMDDEPESLSPSAGSLELESTNTQCSAETIAQIVRSELQGGLHPLQAQLSADRLNVVEESISHHAVRIEKLEEVMKQDGVKNTNADNMAHFQKIEQHVEELQAMVLDLQKAGRQTNDITGSGVASTVAVGGLGTLTCSHTASQWLMNKLKEFSAPIPTSVFSKSSEFKGLLFAKFSSMFERDTAVAILRSAKLMEGKDHIWATPELPPATRARKLFLLGLRWQLGEWGFDKREVQVDDEYTQMTIDNKAVLKLSAGDDDLKYLWAEQWARWDEFQQSSELADLSTKASNVMLKQQAKGAGKTKSKSKNI